MEEKKPAERRKYVRLDIEAKVDFQVKEEKTEEPTSAEASAISRNMSAEGICFRSERKLEPGKQLELEIHLASEPKPLHLGGEVRWSRLIQQKETKAVFDTGVKLYAIDKDDENRFMKYICDKMTERLSQYLHL